MYTCTCSGYWHTPVEYSRTVHVCFVSRCLPFGLSKLMYSSTMVLARVPLYWHTTFCGQRGQRGQVGAAAATRGVCTRVRTMVGTRVLAHEVGGGQVGAADTLPGALEYDEYGRKLHTGLQCQDISHAHRHTHGPSTLLPRIARYRRPAPYMVSMRRRPLSLLRRRPLHPLHHLRRRESRGLRGRLRGRLHRPAAGS